MFFFFKHQTAYELRISDWSSDVCSSDLDPAFPEFPSFLEAYREARGSDPSGPAWEAYLALVSSGVSAQRQVWMHGDTPPEALAAMKEATACVVEREEFYQQGKEILAGYEPIVGEPLARNAAAKIGRAHV